VGVRTLRRVAVNLRAKGRHAAPTNKSCEARHPADPSLRCVRYARHPADLYGRYGHRMKRPDIGFAYVCTRADLAGLPKRPR
jgi:hypothetical protein